MFDNKISKILSISIIFALIFGGYWLGKWYFFVEKLVFCDVGQGDAILYLSRDTQVLIDAGNTDAQVMRCLREYMPPLDKKLEIIVATHADLDHIGGLKSVLAAYEAEFLLIPPYLKDTKAYKEVLEILSRKISGNNFILAFCPQDFSFDLSPNSSLEFWSYFEQKNTFCPTLEPETNSIDLWDFLSRQKLSNMSDNDVSIVSFLTMGGSRVLLPGDLEEKGELALVKTGVLKETDILKVGHHGSNSSSSRSFIEYFRPEKAVISVAKNNRYGHPTAKVLSLLEEFSVQIWRTDEVGDAVFILENGKLEIMGFDSRTTFFESILGIFASRKSE